MNKKFIKLVSCPEIQDRWIEPEEGDRVVYKKSCVEFSACDCPTDGDTVLSDVCKYKEDYVFLPSLEWVIDECENELNKKFCSRGLGWFAVQLAFINFCDELEENNGVKQAWAEYLLYLIKENKNE